MTDPPETVRVLYVDDDPEFAAAVPASLEGEDGRLGVETAADPTAAIAALTDAEDPIDCVVSEYGVAAMSGVEFLKAVREVRPEVPFVLFTDTEAVDGEAVSAGITDYVPKGRSPEHYARLADRITDAVLRSRSRGRPATERPGEAHSPALVERSLDALQDVFYVLDADGEIQHWNETLSEVSGYDDGEIAGLEPVDLFPADERSRVAASIREALETGDSTVRADVCTGTGERVPYEFAATRLTDERGEAIGVAGIGRDITEQIEREWELERTSDLLAQTERIADVGGWELDADTLEVYWSENLFELIGFDAEDAPPLESALDIYHEDDRPVIEDAIEAALESGEPFDTEARYRRADGETRWLRVQGAPVIEDGEVVRIRGAVQDVTERTEYEQRLERQNERLEEFASIVSHDLRNPLNVVEGRARLARNGSNGDHIDAVEDAVARMNRIIDDMLWLAREGRDIGSTDPVDLEATVRTAWTMVAEDAGAAELLVAGDLGTIEADEDRLQQLFENLFRNAIEHAGKAASVTVGALPGGPHSGPEAETETETAADGFYVEDDGPGVPEDERETVFDLGYSTTTEGTGFGLGVVERIAEAHGWTVDIAESADGGARFEIAGVTRPRR
ncbi:hybrid sensor histidine kinase/response regulator [Natronomonas sp.]|uniref:hybrid sensor histidine kinase/response regulator n=1 Tax=Natronomonas sp. TaxID=2184060 RepID=UPI002617585D|nr:PAS domain S-box protein [Natronomonas sp.]